MQTAISFPDGTREHQVPLGRSSFAFGRKLIPMPNSVTGYLRDLVSARLTEKTGIGSCRSLFRDFVFICMLPSMHDVRQA